MDRILKVFVFILSGFCHLYAQDVDLKKKIQDLEAQLNVCTPGNHYQEVNRCFYYENGCQLGCLGAEKDHPSFYVWLKNTCTTKLSFTVKIKLCHKLSEPKIGEERYWILDNSYQNTTVELEGGQTYMFYACNSEGQYWVSTKYPESITNKLSELKKLAETDEKFNNLMNEGAQLESNGNFKDAELMYQQALRLKPASDKANKKINEMKSRQKEAESKKEIEGYLKSGDGLMAKGNTKGALDEYRKAAAKDPDNATVKSKLEQAERKLKEEEQKNQQRKNEERSKEDQQKKEEEARKKEEEARKKEEEEERLRREEEERQRLERQRKFYEEKDKIRQNNQNTANSLGSQALLVHYALGKIIYKNIGEDRYSNIYKGNNYKLNFHAGYTFTSIPTYFNSSRQSYDGNRMSYSNKTINDQTGTFELNGGFEFWPFYGEQYGLGVGGTISLGHGLLFQQFSAFTNARIQGFAGSRKFKIFGEFSVGNRAVKNNAWIEPLELGSGRTGFFYQRLKLGPRLNFESDFFGNTKGVIDILPIFELPSFSKNNILGPININWLPGLAINLSYDNRLQFFTEYFWSYQRGGEVEYSFSKRATFAGKFFKIGVLRNFDFFGESIKAMPVVVSKNFRDKTKFQYINFFGPTFGLVKDRTEQLMQAKPLVGFKVAYFKDYPFRKSINSTMGFGILLNNGGFAVSTNNDLYKFVFSGIYFPVGIRAYVFEDMGIKNWISVSLNNNLLIFRNATILANRPFPLSVDNFHRYLPTYKISGGLDFKTGPDGAFRIGIGYEKSLRPMISGSAPYGAPNNSRVYINQLGLEFGIIF